MSYIEKEKLIKADIASIENRVRHAFNQGYDLGFKNGKEKAKGSEPQPRKGHWIEHEHNGIAHIECSECSSWFLRPHLIRNRYCPNCGAKMTETEG